MICFLSNILILILVLGNGFNYHVILMLWLVVKCAIDDEPKGSIFIDDVIKDSDSSIGEIWNFKMPFDI